MHFPFQRRTLPDVKDPCYNYFAHHYSVHPLFTFGMLPDKVRERLRPAYRTSAWTHFHFRRIIVVR